MIGNQKAEIATVIENFLPELHRQKPLPSHHLRTMYALQRCRTEAMGGRVGNCNLTHLLFRHRDNTWGQNLQYHPHLHLVVPAGGITRNNKWKPSKANGSFLFPVDQMSRVFRAQMVDALRKYVRIYLGRYTHRVAISNNRILQVDDKQVTFSWRDYHQDYKQIITTMKGTDFLKRFSLHILPPGFTRIRHHLTPLYGNPNSHSIHIL